MHLKTLALPLAALFIATPLAAMAQSPQEADRAQRTLTVVGEGRANAAPNLAVTSLTVLRTAETAAEALAEANTASNAVSAALRELGIADRDLQTAGFSINPQYQFDNPQDGRPGNPPKIVGYEVRNSLTVRVRDISKLGDLLDQSIKLGVNQGGDISFQFEDSAALQNDARRDAVAKAQATAETLTEAAGVKLGQIISMSEDGGLSPRPPMPMGAAMRMTASTDESVSIEAGENSVFASVRVVYELLPDTE
ncbi:SIMPL domain-containing protein [Aureimonas fodinaquatilis]|uniref:SIMPL domain-containing protein n=1 Tax=Aureimonas fodinaquatilis TaxID=2565783 RepID=A0A5B0DQE4_9HYPH|nr:SIMPL domain-containing protein [Aureimonas fodinaquatilis]KAA0969027.1 SIMPL domain-containing protein [Aureimonas fodinaquatilis]